jgi:choline dehydrogenase
MLSGIGPAEILRQHGITPIVDSAAVGVNLMEHSGATVSFETTVPTLTSDQGLIRSPLHALNYLVNRKGPLSTPIGHAQAFVRTEDGLAAPDIQIILSPSAHEIVDGQAKRISRPQMALAVGLCRPLSRGSVTISSAKPADPPVINHQLFGDDADVKRLTAGLRIALDVLKAPSFAPFVSRIDSPLDTSDAGLEHHIRDAGILMYHPSGTCRMAPGVDGVVDHRLRVKGLDGLWVADASIIPAIPAGNINATCIMIGEKAADMIREDSKARSMAA